MRPSDDVVTGLARDAAREAADPARAELAGRLAAAFAPFDRRRPPATADLRELLDRLEEDAFVDVDAPTTSARPVVPYVKRGVRQATGWMHRHVAQQVAVLVTGLVGVSRRLLDRVEALEAVMVQPEDDPDAVAPWEEWEDLLAAQAAPVRRASSLAELAELAELAAQAGTAGGGPGPGTVAVAGAPDVVPVAAKRHLARLAAAAAGPGGTVVVLGTDPSAWRALVGTVVADLAPGQPVHAVTWVHLLAAAGLVDPQVHGERGPTYAVVARRPS